MNDASTKPAFTKGGRPGPGRKRLALLAPHRKLSLAEVIDAACSAMGSQVLALSAAAEARGLDERERQWLLDIVDRCRDLEGQRMRIVMAALVSDKLAPAERMAIIAELTGVRPAALEEVKP